MCRYLHGDLGMLSTCSLSCAWIHMMSLAQSTHFTCHVQVFIQWPRHGQHTLPVVCRYMYSDEHEQHTFLVVCRYLYVDLGIVNMSYLSYAGICSVNISGLTHLNCRVQIFLWHAGAWDSRPETGCGGNSQRHALQLYLPWHGQYQAGWLAGWVGQWINLSVSWLDAGLHALLCMLFVNSRGYLCPVFLFFHLFTHVIT